MTSLAGICQSWMGRIWLIPVLLVAALGFLLVGRYLVAHLNQAGELEKQFEDIALEASARHAVSPDLVKAVIRQESGFQPRRVGAAGEIGLMQVTPIAARDWCEAHGVPYRFRGMLSDPRFNIEIGTWYLARGLRRWQEFRDADVLALAEYNAGRSRAIKWAPEDPVENALGNVGFSSTKAYITRILEYRDFYAQETGPTQ